MPTENGFFHHFSTVNKPFWCPNQSFRSEQGFLKIGSQQQTTENGQVWEHGCTNHLNLEMEPKYLTRSDVQLNPNILRTENKKKYDTFLWMGFNCLKASATSRRQFTF